MKTHTTHTKLGIVGAVVTALALQHSSAQVTAMNIGTGLPPGTLGGYAMTPFDPGSIAGPWRGRMADLGAELHW